jgi:hypothetical protein
MSEGRKSIAWSHVVDNKDGTFQCNYCAASLAHKGATKVRDHLLACKMLHDEAVRVALRLEIAEGKRTAAAGAPGPATPQAKRSQTLEEATYQQRASEVQLQFTLFLAAAGAPISYVENEEVIKFARMCVDLGRDFPAAVEVPLIPSRHIATYRLLPKVHATVVEPERQAHAEAAARTGFTFSSDGFTDIQGNKLFNNVQSDALGSIFSCVTTHPLEASTAEVICQDFQNALGVMPGGVRDCIVICADGAAVNTAAVSKLKEDPKYKHIAHIVCTSHSSDLALDDFGKIPVFKDMLNAAYPLIRLFSNRGLAHGVFRLVSPKRKLISYNDTRFGTHIMAMQRLYELRAELRKTVENDIFIAWASKQRDKADISSMVALITSNEQFWRTLKAFGDVTDPVFTLLRRADSAEPGSICDIFPLAAKVTYDIANINLDGLAVPAADVRKELLNSWEARRAVMIKDIHCAAYAMSPSYMLAAHYDKFPPYLKISDRRFLVDNTRRYLQLTYFHDNFAEADTVADALASLSTSQGNFEVEQNLLKQLRVHAASPQKFWLQYGSTCIPLNDVASRVCTQISSSSATERIWSHYDFILNKRRNRLSPRRAEMLVQIFAVCATRRARKRAAARAKAALDSGVPAWPQLFCEAEDDDIEGEADEESVALKIAREAASDIATAAAAAAATASSAAADAAAAAAATAISLDD